MSNELQRITALAATLKAAQAHATALADQLALAKAEVTRLEQEDLPELMREVELTEFTMEDGSTVKVVDEVDCAIAEERRQLAHDWLVKNEFGGLIKTILVVSYDRGDVAKAREDVLEIMKLTGRDVALGEKVHPATLKSFVKEQMEAGKTLPQNLFGIHSYAKAKIALPPAPKKPKAKKAK
jgi:hypothetical protein